MISLTAGGDGYGFSDTQFTVTSNTTFTIPSAPAYGTFSFTITPSKTITDSSGSIFTSA